MRENGSRSIWQGTWPGGGARDDHKALRAGATTISTILIYAALMGCLVLAAFRRHAVVLAAILCLFAFEQWAQANSFFFVTHSKLTNYTTGTILLLGLALAVVSGKRVFAGYPTVGWLSLALYAFALASVSWSVYRSGTIDQWRQTWPYIVTVMGLCPLLIVHPQDLRVGFLATVAMGSVVLVLLFFTTEHVGRDIVLTGGTVRGKGGNPLAVASLAGHVVLISVLMNFRGAGRVWQILRWVVVAIGLVLAIKSGSRGQLFAMMVAMLVFLPVSRRVTSWKGFLATSVAVAVVGALIVWLYGQFATSGRWEWGSMFEAYRTTRAEMVKALMGQWLSSSPVRWLIGLGNSASFDPGIVGSYPHVVLIEVLCEEGMIGFGLFCAVIVLAIRSIVRVYRVAAPYADARGVLAALGALFFFQLLLSFKQGSMLKDTYLFAFAIMLGKFEVCVWRQNEAAKTSTSTIAADDGDPQAHHGSAQVVAR